MMLANISPRISILFRKWLSGFEAAWSSIVRDRQSGGERTLNRAGLLLTNTVPGGRDEDALLSLSAQVWLFSCSRVPRAAPRRHCNSGGLKMPPMSAYAAYRSTRLPMIYASFGQPDPPTLSRVIVTSISAISVHRQQELGINMGNSSVS